MRLARQGSRGGREVPNVDEFEAEGLQLGEQREPFRPVGSWTGQDGLHNCGSTRPIRAQLVVRSRVGCRRARLRGTTRINEYPGRGRNSQVFQCLNLSVGSIDKAIHLIGVESVVVIREGT